ncbi:hypothetical protein PMG71_05760 [Roseofilum sp. BLCC_M154]|uniref:C2H2-type domain-containing protein n=1 Tax=Roseofilum acuticapitatum BLCC-M154 TaxID=3022444 RepID=A0ABT7APW9_9CYAN|nr:hypothetical protein [Roseofilum acuticapitatum]MDJ1168926.1 hypothetical protein [Roseofilum acuticapitatum BLCC-M154]
MRRNVTRPQGMPEPPAEELRYRVIHPHPDLSKSISFKCWDCDRVWPAQEKFLEGYYPHQHFADRP